jgi:dTDP-4-amino-4,6-dideoxygalactose transaminase
MTWCKNRYGLSRNDFPEAARKYDESITLPLWPDMTMDDVERVANAVKAVGTKHGRKAR